MKLDLRAMLAGECRVLPIDYELTPISESDSSSGTFWGVRFLSPMKVKGEILNTAGYMRMHLNLSLDYISPCARCLTDVNGSFTFSFEKTVASQELLEGLDEEAVDDYAIAENGFLDIDTQLLELLEMEFPRRVLCQPDCKGLCAKCGKDLNEGPCNCTEDLDPRLAPLAKILEDLRANEQQ